MLRRHGVVIAVAMLVLFAGAFLRSRQGELAEAAQLLGAVSPFWIVVLATLQVAIVSIAALTYRVILRRLGHPPIGLHQLADIHLKRVLVGVVTPLGGPPSFYVFVRALGQRGIPACDALITASVRSFAGLAAFLVLLIPALLLQQPSGIVIVAAGMVLILLLVMLTLSVILLRQGSLPGNAEQWAPQRVLDFVDAARSHRLTATDFILPVLLGIASHTFAASLLLVGLMAIGHSAAVSTALIGYVIGKLFFMIAPVFQGVGVVEFGMALALQRAGVPAPVAISAALLYRVGDLWLPVFTAFLLNGARLPVFRRAANGLAGTGASVTAAVYRVPARSHALGRPLLALGHLSMATEATLAVVVGTWVTFGLAFSSVL